jgi:hypothetical protein
MVLMLTGDWLNNHLPYNPPLLTVQSMGMIFFVVPWPEGRYIVSIGHNNNVDYKNKQSAGRHCLL